MEFVPCLKSLVGHNIRFGKHQHEAIHFTTTTTKRPLSRKRKIENFICALGLDYEASHPSEAAGYFLKPVIYHHNNPRDRRICLW